MNQPLAKPSRVADPGGGTLMLDQVIQIVTVAIRQPWESLEEQRGMIECALKFMAKIYDSTGNPEAGYLWLDRVSVLAIIW